MRPFWLDELQQTRAEGNARVRRVLRPDPVNPNRVIWRGRPVLPFASNDYLGLARDERLARAALRAIRHEGTGAGASPLVTGWLPSLRALEKDLASLEGAEKALVFPSGFQANLAAISALAGPEDLILSDALNHASLIDGCRLSRATVQVYRHGDLEQANDLARTHRSSHRRLLVVTDSVFSMDGDEAPLEGLADLALSHDGMLLVDEAHATGVMGPDGRGLAHALLPHFQREKGKLIRTGTLSKAMGSQGGFIAGCGSLIRWLVNGARGYLFSTALSPANAMAARAGLRIATREPWRREKVLGLSNLLRAKLAEAGFCLLPGTSPIVPVVLGPSRRAVAWSETLAEAGFLVPAIRYPSVPRDGARLRITLSAHHHEAEVLELARELTTLGRSGR
ncbi:MAG: aminotransferase class I/II-fold pyridoxal phosphate-dependent enzyme [Gemmataceae bacterium]